MLVVLLLCFYNEVKSLSWNLFYFISKYLKKRLRVAVDLIQNIATNVVETIEDRYKADDWVAVKFGSDWFPGHILEVYDI